MKTLLYFNPSVIRVLHYSIPAESDLPDLSAYLAQLPASLQQKTRSYRFWRDKALHLFGKLMLATALETLGQHGDIAHLCYTPYGRPFLEGDLDFNLSHSGDLVVCAIGRGLRLGIDVEQIQPIQLEDFGPTMTSLQWTEIRSAPDPIHKFFSYWTLKESLTKADGRGLSYPMEALHIQEGRVNTGTDNWYTYPLAIDPGYACHLATSLPQLEIRVEPWAPRDAPKS